MDIQAIKDHFIKKFYAEEGQHFSYTQMIQHNGILIAFVLDDRQRFYYTVLDLQQAEVSGSDERAEEFDYRYWTKLKPLPFTAELNTVGYGDIGAAKVPLVLTDDDKKDPFLSSTARFTADAPFQVVSDNQHVYLFRQSVGANDAQMRSNPLGNNQGNVAHISNRLLADRYLLVGATLTRKLEVRYRRSGKKESPASQTDSLGVTNMANQPFVEPTQVLSFVEHLEKGQFSVLLLPTQVADLSKWQIFAYNSQSKLMDSWNLEKSSDGLFNTKGSQLYTSPDPRFQSSVLEREPGNCPWTKRALIPLKSDGGFAESALSTSRGNYGKVAHSPELTPTKELTIETWVRPEETNSDFQRILSKVHIHHKQGYMLSINDAGLVCWDVFVKGKDGTSVKFFGQAKTKIPPGEWSHVAVTMSAKNSSIHIYINGEGDGENLYKFQAYTDLIPNDRDLFFGVAAWGTTTHPLNGAIDEVRLWSTARSRQQIQSHMHTRLRGDEPGLAAYWRMDEAGGDKFLDQSAQRKHPGQLISTGLVDDMWIASEAPIGASAEMQRSSFSVEHYQVAAGPASCLYYEQESAYSSQLDQEKRSFQNARVMLTFPLKPGHSSRPGGLGAIDFGVTRDGQLAQIPDQVSLPNVGGMPDSPRTTEDLLNEIEQKENEIAAERLRLQSPISHECRIMLTNGTVQRNVVRILWELQQGIALYHRVGSIGPDAPEAIGFTPIDPSLQLEAARADEFTFYFKDVSQAGDSEKSYQIINRETGLCLQTTPYKADFFPLYCNIPGYDKSYFLKLGTIQNNDTDTFELTPGTNGGYSLVNKACKAKNVKLSYSESFWNFGLHKIAPNRYQAVDQFTVPINYNDFISSSLSPVDQQFMAFFPLLFTPENEADWHREKWDAQLEKVSFLDLESARLNTLISEWDRLKAEVRKEKRFIMPPLHLDDRGFATSGGLLTFAKTEMAPYFLANGEGDLAMYYRDESSKTFSVAYLDTLTRRVTSNIVGLGLLARNSDQGYEDTKMTIAAYSGPGQQDRYCNVTIINDTLQVRETWNRVPRNIYTLAKVINGAILEPQFVGQLIGYTGGQTDEIWLKGKAPQGLDQGTTLKLGIDAPTHIGIFAGTGNSSSTSIQLKEELQADLPEACKIFVDGVSQQLRLISGGSKGSKALVVNSTVQISKDAKVWVQIPPQLLELVTITEGVTNTGKPITALKVKGDITFLKIPGIPLFRLAYDYFKHATPNKLPGSRLVTVQPLRPQGDVELSPEVAPFSGQAKNINGWKSNSPGNSLQFSKLGFTTFYEEASLALDGKSYAETSTLEIEHSKGFSIECWLSIGKGGAQTILTFGKQDLALYRLLLDDSGKLNFEMFCLDVGMPDLGKVIRIASADIIPTGKWVHVVGVVLPNGNGELFVNGKSATGKLWSQFPNYGKSDFQASMQLGKHHLGAVAPATQYQGRIALVHIWDKPLSKADVDQRTQSGIDLNTSGLIASWRWKAGRTDTTIPLKYFIDNGQGGVEEVDQIPTAAGPNNVPAQPKFLTPVQVMGAFTLESWLKPDLSSSEATASDVRIVHNNGRTKFVAGLSRSTSAEAKLVLGLNNVFLATKNAVIKDKKWQHIAVRFNPAYAVKFDGGYLNCSGEEYFNFQEELSIDLRVELERTAGEYGLLSKGRLEDGEATGVPFSVFLQEGKVGLRYEDESGRQIAEFKTKAPAVSAGKDSTITIIRRKIQAPSMGLPADELTDLFNADQHLTALEDLSPRDLKQNYKLTRSRLIDLRTEQGWTDQSDSYKALDQFTDRAFATREEFIEALKKHTTDSWVNGNLEKIANYADRKVRERVDDSGRANMLVGMQQRSNQPSGAMGSGMLGMLGPNIMSGFQVEIYVDGVEQTVVGNHFADSSRSIGKNLQALEIGRMVRANEEKPFAGTISEVRIWGQALSIDNDKKPIYDANQLASWWRFEENGGTTTVDAVSTIEASFSDHSKLQWVDSPHLEQNLLEVLVDGRSVPAESLTVAFNNDASKINQWKNWYDDNGKQAQFTLGGVLNSQGHVDMSYLGHLEEIRIWNQLRSKEQILDNLFSRVREDRSQLIAYYNCDGHRQVLDHGNRGHHLTPMGDLLASFFPVSTAPINTDIPQVRSELAEINSSFYEKIDATPAVQEYGDLQQLEAGQMLGVMKRCYAYIQDGVWHLFTGFKVGNLVTEWIGQVQFNPQVMGYVEGAPPVPSENMTEAALKDLGHTSRSYIGTSEVELVQSQNLAYTVSHNKERAFNAAFQTEFERKLKVEIDTVIAPLGFGINIAGAVEFGGKFKLGLAGSSAFNLTDSNRVGRNTEKSISVSLGGGWEDPSQQLNSDMSRRFQPANMGFALVQSDTADVFALRMVHNASLVSLRFSPNPDIPKDVNIIPFPINSHYTKQGTLDGRVGYDQSGVVLDPDYRNAEGYGEYSYFKPKEAYRLRNQIEARKQQLISELEGELSRSSAILKGMGGAIGMGLSALPTSIGGFVAAGMHSSGGIGAGVAGLTHSLGSLAMVFETLGLTDQNFNKDLPRRFSERDIANTYVWTADGGFYAENTSLMESIQEVTSGSYQFGGSFDGAMVFGYGGDIGPQYSFEMNGSMGGHLSTTKSKTKDEDVSFSIKVKADPPGDLQAFEKVNGQWERQYDANGNAVNKAGKVDAYRFMTFYLQPDAEHYDELYSKVIDPTWFLQSNHPNANALRQAKLNRKRPACWRIMHRVTFVSRILPEIPDATQAPLESSMRAINVNSHWELIRSIDPLLSANPNIIAGDHATFVRELERAVKSRLPHLGWEKEEVRNELIAIFKAYYGILD